MSIRTECKACGQFAAEVQESVLTYSAPYGQAVQYVQRLEVCSHCGIEIDVSDPTEFPKAVQASEMSSVPIMIDGLVQGGHYSRAGIERALDLPERMVSNWAAKKKVSKGGMALLRIIRSFPWMVDVADRNFDPLEVIRINQCIRQANPFDQGRNHTGSTWFSMVGYEIPTEFTPKSEKNEVVTLQHEHQVST